MARSWSARLTAAGVLTASTAAVLLTALPASAHTTSSAVGAAPAAKAHPGWSRLRAHHSKKCIQIPRRSKKQGVRANQYTCVKQDNEQWALWLIQAPGSGGVRHYIYMLQNRRSGLCLTVDDKVNGAAVTQRTCRNKKYGDDYKPQLFWATPDDRFFSQYAKGKCLDIAGAQKQNGALLTVWKCNIKKNQMFDTIS